MGDSLECYFHTAKDVKKMRSRMEEIMVPAKVIRDCDLAIHLLPESKPAATAELRAGLGRQRKDAESNRKGVWRIGN